MRRLPRLNPLHGVIAPEWLTAPQGAWLTALVVFVSLHFWFPEVGPKPPRGTYSTSGVGKKAFYLLANERGLWVSRNRDSLSSFSQGMYFFDDFGTLCLLGPARYPTEAEWNDVLDWVETGGTLLFAARDDDVEFSIDRLGIKVRPVEDKGQGVSGNDQTVSGKLWTRLTNADDLHWETRGRIETTHPGAERLVEDRGTVQAVSQPFGEGRVVIVASDFVFTNQSLASGDNSVLAFRLLETAATDGGGIYFDESLNASGTPKVVGLLLEPVFRPMTVQLMIGLVVFGWWQSRRFGPVLPEVVLARHNIVDHTDAVGMLHYKSTDGSGPLRNYLRQLAFELKLKSFKGREERVLEPISIKMGITQDEIKSLFRQAGRAAQSGKLDRKTAAEHIRKLSILRRAARSSLKSAVGSRQSAVGSRQ